MDSSSLPVRYRRNGGAPPRWLLAAGLLSAVAACATDEAPAPPPQCVAAWADTTASELTDILVRATGADRAVWTDYGVGDASYVLYTAPPDSTGACVGLWKDGAAVDFALLDEAPALLTPLYGYWFDADWYGGPDHEMLERAAQPAPVRTWLESNGVLSAVVLPVTVADFPMQLPALVKVQLGMHEAFHVDVQAPRWYAGTGNWPAWDEQPDRTGVPMCYTAGDDVAAAFEVEREHLVALIERLLDGDSAAACESCRSFLAQRAARYGMLADVHVARADGTPGTCAEAEAIMELEEGVADWASWTVLHDLGLASRESLIRRYRAIQNEAFYLTGAMQLHAVQLMQPDSMAEIMRRIAGSSGPDDGSPAALLTRALASFCPVRE